MAKIKGKNTAPEIIARRLVSSLDFKYRLNCRHLPGCPDIVVSGCRKVIFVHGCFWHRHYCRRGRSMPTSRVDFWRAKFDANRKRDRQARKKLREKGWRILTLWECQLKPGRLPDVITRLRLFMEAS